MRFEEWQPPEIEHGKLTKWNWLVQHPENLEMGKGVDLGAFTYINAKHGVVLEEGVQVGSHCSIYSTSTIDGKQGKVVLKRNSSLGTHSSVMPGVTIGENSLIGAHSFVNKNIPENVVAFGVPAKVFGSLGGKSPEVKEAPRKLPLFKTYSDQSDVEAVCQVIRRGTSWANGPEIAELEQKTAEYIGTKYALAFNSGTSALHALLLAHGVKGKEVIVPSFTFIATANAVVLAGGIPIFAETEDPTFGLDLEDVRKKITSRTKAIITIHYAGFPAKYTLELKKIATEKNILFLEDAAESFGAHILGKKVGSFGDSAILSFCQNKIISTGEGGMIVTSDQEVYEKAKLIRSHGRVELGEDYFSTTSDNDYVEAGYNFRMPSLCAALGLSQLGKVDYLISQRREKAHYLKKELAKIPGISFLEELEGHFPVYQMFTIKLPNREIRDQVQSSLSARGIQSKVYFNPVHLKTIYQQNYGCKKGDLPVTEYWSERVLSLPFYPALSQEEMDFLIQSLDSAMKI